MTLTLERTEPPGLERQTMQLCVLGSGPAEIEHLQEIAGQFGYGSTGTSDPQRALDELNRKCRVVLADLHLPALDGFAFLEQALKRDPGTFVILLANENSIEAAIEAIRHGAYDYLRKPVDRARLKKTLDELSDQLYRRRRISNLNAQLLNDLEFHGIVGRSAGMLELFDLTRKVARHYNNVLITGATAPAKNSSPTRCIK